MLDVMKAEFEKRHQFAVTDDMDIIYGLVWESWQIAWNAATKFEREECAKACENGNGFEGDHAHDVFAAAIRARSQEIDNEDPA